MRNMQNVEFYTRGMVKKCKKLNLARPNASISNQFSDIMSNLVHSLHSDFYYRNSFFLNWMNICFKRLPV